jgi:hypothetical protein
VAVEPAGRMQIPCRVASSRGQPGRSIQRREPVTNTRTPAYGAPSVPWARNMRSTICTQASALPSANPPPGYIN